MGRPTVDGQPVEMERASLDDEHTVPELTCHVCGAADLTEVGAASGLKGVTSDCKPWPRSLPVAACGACGLIQKPVTADWLDTIAQVYDAYTIYHQSPGAEQAVFDGASGVSAPRSRRLLSRLIEECRLRASGRLLDIGCGNGVLLRTFADLAPGWGLAGADLDDRHRSTVLSIPGVDRFYAGPAEEIADQFDVITMQHVLEHVPHPVDLLRQVGRLLTPGGLLFIQVPNILDNPFDLMVVDHSSHFAPETARTTIGLAGLRPVVLAADWAPKELTIVAAASDGPGGGAADGIHAGSEASSAPAEAVGSTAEAYLVGSLRWLAKTAAEASVAAGGSDFGVLGTSIAATWIGNMVGDGVRFFVDEDSDRIGRPFMDRPVIHPESVPAGARVHVAFPPVQARRIQGRLANRYPDVHWLVPPERS